MSDESKRESKAETGRETKGDSKGETRGDSKGERGGQDRRRFQGGRGGAVDVTEKRGLRRIPVWLTQEKGLPDWLAGSVVVVGSGFLLTIFVWFLVLVWPA